ncbi:MAG: helix-turn-helix domain-containing protein [Burkholderiales bacterium]
MGTVEFTESELEARALIQAQPLALSPLHFARVIQAAVAQRHGMTVDELRGRCREPKFLAARRALYRALRDAPAHWSYPEIGAFVGRHHTTVMSALGATSRARRLGWGQ